MNNAINMLPCPMCGCTSINVKNEQPTDNSGGYFIECPDCGISTSLRYACGDDPIPLLAEQWNRRATAQCLHQIAEPVAPVVKPIKDAIDALVMAAFTEGGCSEHRMSEARIQTELRKKELRTLIAATQPAAQGLDANDAEMFWYDDDSEQQYGSIEEFLNNEICNGNLDVGSIRTMQRGIRLPNIAIRVTAIDEEESEATYEIIDRACAAQAKQGGQANG